MKTRLLILALLAAPIPSRAQTSAETLARVEREASSWIDWSIRAADMESAFVDGATRNMQDPKPSMQCLANFDQDEVTTVRRYNEWRGERLARWRSQAAVGAISKDEAERRASYVERLYKLRMLRVYAYLWPGSIDTCSLDADGRPNGRFLAGPGWAMFATKAYFDAAEQELIRRSGFSEEEASAP
jgi:hypothetical protein